MYPEINNSEFESFHKFRIRPVIDYFTGEIYDRVKSIVSTK